MNWPVDRSGQGVLAPGHWFWLRAIAWMTVLFASAIMVMVASLELGDWLRLPDASSYYVAILTPATGLGLYAIAVKLGERRTPVELSLRQAPTHPRRFNRSDDRALTMRYLHIGLIVSGCVAISTATAGSRYPFDPAPVLIHDPKQAVAGDYRLEIGHSSITIRLSHMGLSFYTMRFDNFSGHYSYDPQHPAASKIEIAIDPISIDTGNSRFNAMIAADYFEVAKFPSITFASSTIRASGDHGTVTGMLDMHGVSKPIVLHVTYHGFYGDEKPERMGFSATTTLKRSDFGVDPSVPAEGDDAAISIEAEFRRD